MKRADCPYCGFYGHWVSGNTYKCERCGKLFTPRTGFMRFPHINYYSWNEVIK